MVQAHSEDDQSGRDAVGDENHENGPVSGTSRGREQDQKTPATRHGLFRGPGSDQLAHEQPEIVPGDMDQIAFLDVLPGGARSTVLETMISESGARIPRRSAKPA